MPAVGAHRGFLLPVPPRQLFPSGGFISTLHGPRYPMAHFFACVVRDIAWRRNACFRVSKTMCTAETSLIPLDEVAAAHADMEAGRSTGSILLLP